MHKKNAVKSHFFSNLANKEQCNTILLTNKKATVVNMHFLAAVALEILHS